MHAYSNIIHMILPENFEINDLAVEARANYVFLLNIAISSEILF